jgi:flavorubredoxin
MGKALVVFATRNGSTEKIAELIAEGIRMTGHTALVTPAGEIQSEKQLTGYDAYVFGSPTYHGEMLQAMKTFLFLAEKAGLSGRVGGAFGAFGWSGEAGERIYQTMKNVFGMDMAPDHLRLKDSSLGGGRDMAQDYGRQVANKMGGPA